MVYITWTKSSSPTFLQTRLLVPRAYWYGKPDLRTAISTHLILDLQDFAWHIGLVHVRITKNKRASHTMTTLSAVGVLSNKVLNKKKKKKKLL